MFGIKKMQDRIKWLGYEIKGLEEIVYKEKFDRYKDSIDYICPRCQEKFEIVYSKVDGPFVTVFSGPLKITHYYFIKCGCREKPVYTGNDKGKSLFTKLLSDCDDIIKILKNEDEQFLAGIESTKKKGKKK